MSEVEGLREAYEKTTALVTGGAGFIGSNLVRRLLALRANKVIILDDLSASYSWNIPADSRVKFVQGSLLDDEKLTSAFEARPEHVFHLAAHFANQNSVDHPEHDLMVNGMGTVKVLRLAYASNAERLVYASSGCSVYGNEAPLPLEENFVSLHLDTPYQVTKLLGELYCNYFHHYYGLATSIPRFFNVYGPGEVPGKYRNVIPNFIYWALSGLPLPITGTGKETRDFTFVNDVVTGILNCGYLKEAIGEAVNLASGHETRILELANLVNDLVGSSKGVVFREKRDWDKSTRRRASIKKAERLLKYTPTRDLKEGVAETIKWFKENWDLIRRDARF